jgi:uncharacterized protein YecT (DUF1311 family)
MICGNVLAQDSSDAIRLAKLEYMENSDKINCDNTSESNIENKICLNLEFQRLDSILNVRYDYFLNSITEETIRTEVIEFHYAWVENRRIQSELISKGLSGHSLGIYYLDCMVNMTKRRIEEIEYLIERK